jgi:hypothetical protein
MVAVVAATQTLLAAAERGLIHVKQPGGANAGLPPWLSGNTSHFAQGRTARIVRRFDGAHDANVEAGDALSHERLNYGCLGKVGRVVEYTGLDSPVGSVAEWSKAVHLKCTVG